MFVRVLPGVPSKRLLRPDSSAFATFDLNAGRRRQLFVIFARELFQILPAFQPSSAALADVIMFEIGLRREVPARYLITDASRPPRLRYRSAGRTCFARSAQARGRAHTDVPVNSGVCYTLLPASAAPQDVTPSSPSPSVCW